jgi:pimeloyl-ACP methyl ester carboxylesterase
MESILDTAYARAKHLTIDGKRLCYVDHGSGPVLVFLHGIPLSLVTWRHNLQELSQRHRTIAIDLPGFGRSEPRADDHGVLGQAASVAGLLAQLDVREYVVIASSYACAVALQLALKHPAAVQGLVLVNSIGYPGGRHSHERVIRMAALTGLARVAFQSSYLRRRAFESVLHASYANRASCTKELADAYYAPFEDELARDAYLQTLAALQEGDVLAWASKVQQQSIVIWGAKDAILPVANAEKLAKLMPHASSVTFPAVGHFPHEEDPSRFNAAVAKFVSELHPSWSKSLTA